MFACLEIEIYTAACMRFLLLLVTLYGAERKKKQIFFFSFFSDAVPAIAIATRQQLSILMKKHVGNDT